MIPTFWLSDNSREKARKWSLIFLKLNLYCIDQMFGHFMFFIGKLFKHLVVTISSAVKKAGVLNLQICCLTAFGCEWQSMHLFGNEVGEGQRKLLGINCFKHFNCYNFFSCEKLVCRICRVVVWISFLRMTIFGLFGIKGNWGTTQIVGRLICLLWKSGLLSKIIIEQC